MYERAGLDSKGVVASVENILFAMAADRRSLASSSVTKA
jgi:hypothetical protein